MKEHLLQAIWSGEIWRGTEGRNSRLSDVLRTLTPQPVFHVVSDAGVSTPFAGYGSTIVEGRTTLADVLEQEFECRIRDHDIVLIEPRAFAEGACFTDTELAKRLGHMLMNLVSSGQPEETLETDAAQTKRRQDVGTRMSSKASELVTHLN